MLECRGLCCASVHVCVCTCVHGLNPEGHMWGRPWCVSASGLAGVSQALELGRVNASWVGLRRGPCDRGEPGRPCHCCHWP